MTEPSVTPPAASRLVDDPVTRLFESHYRGLVGVARLLVDDGGEAEEVVQEAFARLHVRRGDLRDADNAAAYLRATVVNLSRGRLRRRATARRHDRPDDRWTEEPDDLAVRDDERRRLAAAVRALPRRQRECIVLRYFLDLSEAQTAAAIGVSTGSVKTHVHRALAALSPRLEELR